MDVQLKELLEKINQEGVKSAEEKAAEIVAAAEKKAEDLVAQGEKKAASIVENARQEAERFEQSGKDALKQAGRDLVLNLEKEITLLFDAVLKKKTAESLKGEALKSSVVSVVKGWTEKGSADIALLLSDDDFTAMEKELNSALAAEMKKGVEIKPSKNVDAGFLISEKDGSAYYNFSADGIAEILAESLNPRLAAILKNKE